MQTINQRLAALRQHMQDQRIDAILVPSADAHQSEYVSDRDLVRAWISGFTGSAGTAIITMDHAGVFTDGRYYIQAEEELASSEFVLHKYSGRASDQELRWLADHLSEGSTIAVNGEVFPMGTLRRFEKILQGKSMSLRQDVDLFTAIWSTRPETAFHTIYEHAIKYAGIDRSEKIEEVREKMKTMGASHHLITTLDDIGWLLNLRGSDVTYNPVFFSYVLITPTSVQLYCDTRQISEELRHKLAKSHIELLPYDKVTTGLSDLPDDATLLLDPSTVNGRLAAQISCTIIEDEMPTRHLKAIKNPTEVDHIRQCMIYDGVALAKAFYWLEQALEIQTVSEVELAEKLKEMRALHENYVSESFNAIVGYRGNGATIHYKPEKDKCADISKKGMLLVDSGGQYLHGTTDITRTFTLSPATPQQRLHYTLVLKGMITLTKATFPKGTCGQQLDTLARMHLWDEGLNFAHGTGHGVGFFMNVHEPPQGFATAGARAKTVHQPGMLSSNEPGCYLEGEYGIRIENLFVTKESSHEGFLEHETLTLYPLELELIDETVMTTREKAWLNKYQHKCYTLISPHLSTAEKEWFRQKCKPLN